MTEDQIEKLVQRGAIKPMARRGLTAQAHISLSIICACIVILFAIAAIWPQ